MHKSRLSTLVIDCQTSDLESATEFWSQALGYPAETAPAGGSDNYSKLLAPPEEVQVLLQEVDHQSRVHIDIETDDIEAEVQRLENLGARRLGYVKTWCVMEAPTGHRFCVVRPQRTGLERDGHSWV